jgi:hypothetical protein
MVTSRPERPSLPALKVDAPNSSPSAGQTIRERGPGRSGRGNFGGLRYGNIRMMSTNRLTSF